MTSDKRGSRPKSMNETLSSLTLIVNLLLRFTLSLVLTLYISHLTWTLFLQMGWDLDTESNEMWKERKGKFAADSLVIALKRSRHIIIHKHKLAYNFQWKKKREETSYCLLKTSGEKIKNKKKTRRWEKKKTRTRMTFREFQGIKKCEEKVNKKLSSHECFQLITFSPSSFLSWFWVRGDVTLLTLFQDKKERSNEKKGSSCYALTFLSTAGDESKTWIFAWFSSLDLIHGWILLSFIDKRRDRRKDRRRRTDIRGAEVVIIITMMVEAENDTFVMMMILQ